MNELTTISILLLAQSVFDFVIWFWVYREQSGHPLEFIFRIGKFLIDFPVTIWLVWSPALIPFYVLKWFGWADGLYMLYSIAVTGKPYWTENGQPKVVYWLWWTPLGLYRTINAVWYYRKQFGWMETFKEFSVQGTILKARITKNEFIGGLFVSVPLACIALMIFYYVKTYLERI